MTIKIDANTWIWTSPLTTVDVERLAPHAAGMGFDLLELPVEGANDFDYAQAAQIPDRAALERTSGSASILQNEIRNTSQPQSSYWRDFHAFTHNCPHR